MAAAGVYGFAQSLPRPCLPRKGQGTRAARSHPRDMSVNRGTACPRSCSRYPHALYALCRLRLVLPVRPVPGLASSARLRAALPGTFLGRRAWPLSVPADGSCACGSFARHARHARHARYTRCVRCDRHTRCAARHVRAGPDRTAPGPWLLRPAVLVAARRARPGVGPRTACLPCHAIPVRPTLPRRPAGLRGWRVRTGRPRPRLLRLRAR